MINKYIVVCPNCGTKLITVCSNAASDTYCPQCYRQLPSELYTKERNNNLSRARVYKILSNSDEYVSHRVSGVLTLRRAKIIERNKKIIADVKTHPDIPITEIASKYNISPSIVYTVLRTQ